jgi:hypothetical protein
MISTVQSNKMPSSHVMSVAKFERFVRIAAGLDVDKQNLKRYSDFINHKIYDLLVDLPITKGLQESIHEFEKIDEQIELQPILDQLTARPPLDLGEDTESRLPEVVGFQDHRWQSEEPGNRALAEVLPYLRSADVAPPDNIYFELMTS